jgi:hypothetical protein
MTPECCWRYRAQGDDEKGEGTQNGPFCVPGPPGVCAAAAAAGRRLRHRASTITSALATATLPRCVRGDSGDSSWAEPPAWVQCARLSHYKAAVSRTGSGAEEWTVQMIRLSGAARSCASCARPFSCSRTSMPSFSRCQLPNAHPRFCHGVVVVPPK